MNQFISTDICNRSEGENTSPNAQIAELRDKCINDKHGCKNSYCAFEGVYGSNFCHNCDHSSDCICHHLRTKQLNEQKKYRLELNVEIAQLNAQIDKLRNAENAHLNAENTRISKLKESISITANDDKKRLERCVDYASKEIDKLHNIVHFLIIVSSVFLGIIVYLTF